MPLIDVDQAQEGRRLAIAAGGTRGFADFDDALKSWNSPASQAHARSSVWRELSAFGLSVLGVALIGIGLRADLVAAWRLTLAVWGFAALLTSAMLIANLGVERRSTRKFKLRNFEDVASLIFVAMSLTTMAVIGLTLYEPIRYFARDALDFEVLIGQLAATVLMVAARKN